MISIAWTGVFMCAQYSSLQPPNFKSPKLYSLLRCQIVVIRSTIQALKYNIVLEDRGKNRLMYKQKLVKH
jgi:hypothetical protein